MDPILYIATGELPNDRDKAHKVLVQSARFSMIDERLYKQSLGGPYLMCLTPEQGDSCHSKVPDQQYLYLSCSYCHSVTTAV